MIFGLFANHSACCFLFDLGSRGINLVPMIETEKITSRDNARLKFARRVRDGREDDAIFVEGIRLAEDVLRSGLVIREWFVSSKALKNERVETVAGRLIDAGIMINEVSDDLFSSISDTENPQGLLLICDRPGEGRSDLEQAMGDLDGKIPIVVFLEEANNPSNLGAILRAAEAAGTPGVILSKNSADPFSPKSLRGSMGSAFRIPVWTGATLDEAVEWASECQMTVTAADIAGEKAYTQIDWKRPRLLVFGSEAHGLRDADKEKIQDLIRIPMDQNVESLNLAVSAGVILFEAKRQSTA